MPSDYRDPRAPAPNQPLRVGALALIERDGALLVERRADDGTWGLIGGALTGGGSISEALRRAVQAETGLATRSIELFGVFVDPSRVDDENGTSIWSEESRELRWVPHHELARQDLTPARRAIVERFLGRTDGVILE